MISAKQMSETAQRLYEEAEKAGEATPDSRMAFIAGVGWALQDADHVEQHLKMALPEPAGWIGTWAMEWIVSRNRSPDCYTTTYLHKSQCTESGSPIYTEQQVRAMLATGEHMQADLSNVISWLEGGCDPKHAATELRLIADKTAIKPHADARDADCEWEDIASLPHCDDLIWLYCQDTNTIDGPVEPSQSFVDAWSHWAYANAPSTAVIDRSAISAAKDKP